MGVLLTGGEAGLKGVGTLRLKGREKSSWPSGVKGSGANLNHRFKSGLILAPVSEFRLIPTRSLDVN